MNPALAPHGRGAQETDSGDCAIRHPAHSETDWLHG
jgi:hypothetical protein